MGARPVIGTLAALTVLLCGACGVGPFGGDSPTPTPAPTLAPVTPAPTRTVEPTPTGPTVVTHARIRTTDLNVRVGPGRQYLAIGRLQPDDNVGILGRSEDGDWLALDGLGWAFYDQTWYQLDAEVSTLPTVGAEASAAPTHPPGTDTGFPLLNDVIADVQAGSAAALAARVAPRSTPCIATVDAAAGPPCGAGEAGGTAVDAIALSACAPEWAPADGGREAVDRFLAATSGARSPLRLYAVLAAAPDDPAATYVVLFAFGSGEGRALWLGQSGAITRLAVGCDAQPAGYFLTELTDQPVFYVTPFAPEPLAPLQ